MQHKKNIAVIITFFAVLLGISLAQFLPDEQFSPSERRKLAQKPQLTVHALQDGTYTEDLEAYLLDQFPLREQFRTVQAAMNFYFWQRMDSNGIWLKDDYAFSLDPTLHNDQLTYGVDYINNLINTHFQDSNVYYALIPDRNYFMQESAYPTMDYQQLIEGYREIQGTYIDLMPYLTLEDYYRTDAHWKQESIGDVAYALCEQMGTATHFTPLEQYTPHTIDPFYGVYMGQAALPLKADRITYLSSPQIDAAVVTGAEFTGTLPVYTPEKPNSLDAYDVYLNGAQAVLTITCPNTESTKELIIFRDSFASSITPYLIGAYRTITLVDTRYINQALLEQYVDMHGQDVLFLYSSTMLNSARLWK